MKRSRPICFNCSLQSQAREAGQSPRSGAGVEDELLSASKGILPCLDGERTSQTISHRAVHTADKLQKDARRAKDDSSFIRLGARIGRSAIVSSEKVRGALFDDGHGMRKRKDSPPGMLPSRDGKAVVQHTGQGSDGNRASRRQQEHRKGVAGKTRGRCTICQPSGHEFVGALVCSSRLSRPSARGYPLVVWEDPCLLIAIGRERMPAGLLTAIHVLQSWCKQC